jgi:CubicO group peptidase (beta-lactamase class C family)
MSATVNQAQELLFSAMQRPIQNGELAGAAGLVWSKGKLQTVCSGWRDMEANLPIERDTLFRIASMTKPITSVAALMLVDEARIAVDDPITRYAPEFSNMRVLRSPDAPLDETEAASRPITFEDLLTHRSGLTYGDFHRGPISQAYREARVGDIDSDLAPHTWIANLAKLPLIDQPARGMHYGHSVDLLGLLIARIEGAPLGAVLRRRLFGPLAMHDTGFSVPREKWRRRAAAYGFDEHGRLTKHRNWGGVVEDRSEDMAFASGGAGLWSTLDDYLKFARIFLGDGEVDGVRLLRPETLAMMMTNQLTDTQRANSGWLGYKPFATGRGFGLGVSVVMDANAVDLMPRGGPGTVSWPGAFGGWWQADPNAGAIFIFLTHNMVDPAQMAQGIGLGVWDAIDKFHAAALASICTDGMV